MSDAPLQCRICLEIMNAHPMGTLNDWKFIACKACGSVMLDPWPTAAEIEQFFADVQPEITHVPNPEEEIASIKKTIQKICKDPNGKTFIDISSRQGYAVEAAWQLGMQAQGLDRHEFFHRFSKEKYPSETFAHISVEEFAKDSRLHADIVYSDEAFCESLDPDLLAASLAKLVAVNGKIYISEPDGNSFNIPKNFLDWAFIQPPMNFLYISKKGMTKLLARHGLKIQKSYFVWAPYMRLVVTKK